MENSTQTNSNKPSHYAYQVRDTEDGQGFWTRIGAVWPTRNEGFTLQLDAVPLDGRIVCQIPRENPNS